LSRGESAVIFQETRLRGAYIVDVERREDDRGFFARAFCRKEFADRGLRPFIAQANVGYSTRKGTLRGMHFQFPPHGEAKLVRVTRGAVADIIVDMRPESPTYLQHVAVTLTADDRRALYIPDRFAHGYQTLENETETWYQTSEFYAPGTEGGLSPLDPRLALPWPLPVSALSEKDAGWQHLDQSEAEIRRRMAL
jgi:dTDP-4-dehydrorhamnose 3,5-epimerase